MTDDVEQHGDEHPGGEQQHGDEHPGGEQQHGDEHPGGEQQHGDEHPAPAPAPATVRRVGDWHVITANGYQVSIGPDSCIQLPRHVHPTDAADFAAAFTIAAQVASDVHAGNIAAAEGDDRALAQRKALVTEGGAPAGSVRMRIAERQSEQATIGRPNRGRHTNPAAVKVKTPLLTRQQRARQAQDQTGTPDGRDTPGSTGTTPDQHNLDDNIIEVAENHGAPTQSANDTKTQAAQQHSTKQTDRDT